MIEMTVEDPATPEIVALLEAGDAFVAGLYPPGSNHMLSIDDLRKPNVTFVVARGDGVVVGCGAVVTMAGEWAELKRMFVVPAARGRGVGRSILQTLEGIAAASGARYLRLETGVRQPEALSLYRTAHFAEIGPFGGYKPDPLSVFMEKRIG
jgi:putative acetyltransferase